MRPLLAAVANTLANDLPGAISSNEFLNSATSVVHTFGYPLGMDTKGGGFLYKMADNRVSLGLVTGLDYADAAPVSGTRVGGAGETLDVSIDVAQQ